MTALMLYTTCVAAMLGLYLLVRPGPRAAQAAGALLGLGAVGWLLVSVPSMAAGQTYRPEIFFLLFAALAIVSAARMITHRQPVYAALYFILVVLSSAGLFLLCEAEFMAFALIIVYAGAILVTYVFVLMLAQQSPTGGDPSGQPEYDRVPREPAAAAVVGFIMLALLTNLIFDGPATLPRQNAEAARAAAWRQLDQLPVRRDRIVESLAPGASLRVRPDGSAVYVRDGAAYVEILRPGEHVYEALALPPEAMPENVQRVGLALILDFPVSLELAGVILTMAMLGAVVLARRQIELGEDELREAAGLDRLGYVSEEEER